MAIKIIFLVPYPLKQSPSQRFRFEQYFQKLTDKGHSYNVFSFLNSHNWQTFYSSGKPLKKLLILLTGFLKRFYILFTLSQYHFVFIHREATPLGPPVIEWLIAKVFKKKIIYDFDDAIWLTDRPNESKFLKWVKARYKVGNICWWSYKVSCGNQYLADYARRFNSEVVYNPTTVDTEGWHNPSNYIQKAKNYITIGWTGSHSTLKYLNEIQSVLKRILQAHINVKFIVIANHQPHFDFAYQFIQWNEASEIEDLMAFDIGIMPLPDDEWSKGKCGFKALQYMALEIPVVVSPVGVNTNIIHHAVNGFLATTQEEWYVYLDKLILESDLRKVLGKAGRQKVCTDYSVQSNTRTFLSLFE